MAKLPKGPFFPISPESERAMFLRYDPGAEPQYNLSKLTPKIFYREPDGPLDHRMRRSEESLQARPKAQDPFFTHPPNIIKPEESTITDLDRMVREARERQAAPDDEPTWQTFRVNPRGDLVPGPDVDVIPNDLPGPIERPQTDNPRYIDEGAPSGDLIYPLDEFQLNHRIPDTRYFSGPAPKYPMPGDVFLDAGHRAQPEDIPKEPKIDGLDLGSK